MGLIPGLPVLVDCFKQSTNNRDSSLVYFLTHAHADHTEGLSPSWDRGIVYCTEITRKFILRKFNLDPALVIALEYCEHKVQFIFGNMQDTESQTPKCTHRSV